ncbi:hypothetical protein [Bradyrhizobium sp. AUGA SZCCT0283]|uniref:hypothetical protein n=1 Tax=Bradyrhizobium sp. AUGA SZCCT0283 TaxID=2807671 RepID=UPI002011F04F|nr:hypothetical protein [Bradyrhizobium sp. AUGA SZCCT0283]
MAAKLDLAEAFGTDAKSAAEPASVVSADESALRGLLVAPTTPGLCNRADRDKFAMADLGRQLDRNADPSFKYWVLFEGELLVQSWSGLVDSVRTGRPRSRSGETEIIATPRCAIRRKSLAGSTPRWLI